jgi:lysozyme
VSAQLLMDLERDEGYRAVPYRDSRGIWTFAVGRNLEDRPLTGAEWKTLLDAGEISISISSAGAGRLLAADANAVVIECSHAFPWWPTIGEVRRDALANLAFNIGLTRLLQFRRMLAAIARQDWESAASELLDSDYARQVGQRAVRLAHMLRTGQR